MATYTASSTADLVKFAGLAASGDTIRLNSGNFRGVTLQDLTKSGNVTITSADPNNPAVLTDLIVKNCDGLTFTNLELQQNTDMPFQVLASSRINFDQLNVHGTLNGSSNDDGRAMIVRNSDNVTVTNSHFHELTDALSHDHSRNLTFSGNLFETIRDNGISGGGSSFVTVKDNVFKDFDHVGGVHPDAIQFWTIQTNAPATDITITGNVFNRGTGVPIQGIFVTDQIGIPYQRVTISDNVVVGGIFNGIVVSGATDATLANNVVLGQTDQASWLGVWSVDSATLSGNITSGYSNKNSMVNGSGDIRTTPLTNAAAAALSAQLDAIATPGQLAGVAAKFAAQALAQVYWLDYVDSAPAGGGSATFDMVPLDGTSGSDTLRAPTLGSYYLKGFDGDDRLIGGSSGQRSSILEGGDGNDTYTIYNAADVIVERPGEGTDSVYALVDYTLSAGLESIRARAVGITIHGNGGDNSVMAGAGGNTLYGEAGDDVVQGNTGDDVLFGNDGIDRLFGNAGDDTLDGGNGDDRIYGADGDDTILGGDGDDWFEAGAGADILTGGNGADSFTFRAADFAAGGAASRDTIKDFDAAEGDKISVGAVDAKIGSGRNDAFTFIGTQAFHGIAGELRYVLAGDGIDVLGDTNGDKVANLSIHLTGVTSIASSSFIL